MNKKPTKKQHIVPQNYLRRFADADEGFFGFDKTSLEVFPARVKEVAYHKSFYDLTPDMFSSDAVNENFNPQMVEDHLADIEGSFKQNLDDMLANVETAGVLHEHRIAIASYIAIQAIRTQEFRSQIVELYSKAGNLMFKKIAEREPDAPPIENLNIKFNQAYAPLLQAEMMFDSNFAQKLAAVIADHIWIVAINKTPQPFYTSDHPVAKQAHATHPLSGMSGYGSKGVEISYPLTSNRVLVMYERSFHRKVMAHDGKTMLLTEKEVDYYNTLQVYCSYRQVYCLENKFDLARKICRDYPHICEPQRERVNVHAGDE